jgi:hypothetical protein
MRLCDNQKAKPSRGEGRKRTGERGGYAHLAHLAHYRPLCPLCAHYAHYVPIMPIIYGPLWPIMPIMGHCAHYMQPGFVSIVGGRSGMEMGLV